MQHKYKGSNAYLGERHVERLGVEDLGVHLGDCLGGLFGLLEAHETEALGAAVLVGHHLQALDFLTLSNYCQNSRNQSKIDALLLIITSPLIANAHLSRSDLSELLEDLPQTVVVNGVVEILDVQVDALVALQSLGLLCLVAPEDWIKIKDTLFLSVSQVILE